MKLSVLLSVVGVSGLVWVCPVVAETGRLGNWETREKKIYLNHGGMAEDLLAQGVTRVTGVEVNQTPDGLELILKTVAGSERLVPLILPEGNDLVIDILDATLAFSIRNGVTETNPAPGISRIAVNKVDDTSIRLTITGESQTPSAEIVPSRQNLVLSVTPEKTTAQEQEDEPDQEINIVVTSAEVGTRTETDSQDVPQAIQTIPQEIIEQRETNNIAETLRTVPGVISSNTTFLFDSVDIRGFGADFRRNGLRDSFGRRSGGQTANIERIEILKGPASVLYGQGSFGGTINIITEKPTDEPFYQVDAAIGNFDLYRGAIDLSGPLNESKSVKYRLNLAAETENSFIDDVGRERYLIAPVLSWEIDKNTDIAFEVQYTNLNADNNFGLPAVGTVLDNINGEIDPSRYIGDADIEKREANTIIAGYDLEHRFSKDWKIRNAFQFGNRTAPEFSIFPSALQEDERTLERRFADTSEFTTNTYLLDTYVVGNFNTGGIEHELLTGIELFRSDTSSDIAFGDANTIDLFAPELDNTVVQPTITNVFRDESRDQTLGIYVQDKIKFTDNLILLAGVRFDIVNTRFEDFEAETVDFEQEEEFSPRIGVVYKVIPEVSLYASYSRSFVPNFGSRNREGELFPPQRGEQFEVGTKAELNEKISVSLAYFDTTISNIPTNDPDDILFEVITGEQNSKGVELFASGEILSGWSVIGGYTYNDATITEDNVLEVGNRLNNIPEHAVSFLTSYELQQGSLKGLGGSLGIYFVGDRQGDLDNSFEVPSYTRTDASIFYNRDRFKTALNFRNLFDIDYVADAQNDLRVRYGAPFTVIGSVSYEF